MINFIKKYWFFVLLAALAGVLSGLWLLQPHPSKEIIDESLPKVEKLVFEGISIQPSTRLNFNFSSEWERAEILGVTERNVLNPQAINHIAQVLGFTTEPTTAEDIISGQVYIWTRDGYSLSITPKTNTIKYGLDDIVLNPPTQAGTLLNPTIAKDKFLSLLNELGIAFGENINFQQKERYLRVSGIEIKSAVPTEASMLELEFNLVFGQIPIVTNSPHGRIMSVRFDKNGNILGFETQNTIKSLSRGQEYPLKNIEEIKMSLLNEGKMLQTTLDYAGTSLEDITLSSITMSEIQLAYYINEEAITLQPIYIMRGTGQSTTGQSYPVWIYLPAIKSQYFIESTLQPF